MFRPNRIGHPWIHEPNNATASVAAFTQSTRAYYETLGFGNVINAAPVQDLASNTLVWFGTVPEAIAAGVRLILGQQFTVTAPLVGDTVGLELAGALEVQALPTVQISPVIYRMTAALGSVLAGADSSEAPITFGPTLTPDAADGQNVRSHSYKEEVIMKGTNANIGGTYFHGFAISDVAGAGYNLPFFRITCSIRQLNDQQNVGYRDTLR